MIKIEIYEIFLRCIENSSMATEFKGFSLGPGDPDLGFFLLIPDPTLRRLQYWIRI